MPSTGNFPVTEQAMRPASTLRQCFYCHQAIGENHLSECPTVLKKVIVKATIEYTIDVPAYWDADMIEFHRNESSWCADNLIDELKKTPEDGSCLCSKTTFQFISDAEGEPFLKEC